MRTGSVARLPISFLVKSQTINDASSCLLLISSTECPKDRHARGGLLAVVQSNTILYILEPNTLVLFHVF